MTFPIQILRMANAAVTNVTFVGAGSTSSQGTATSTFSSFVKDEANVAPTILEGDYVFLGVSAATSATSYAAQGYTQVGSWLTSVDTVSAYGSVWYKKMGATPDTGFTIQSSGATAVQVVILRNVHQTVPLDVTATTATGIDTSVPDCPSITPVTKGAGIICFGMGGIQFTTAGNLTIPSNADTQTNRFKQSRISNSGTTFTAAGAVAMKMENGPTAFNMAAFGGGVTNTTGAWCAFTLAIRPK